MFNLFILQTRFYTLNIKHIEHINIVHIEHIKGHKMACEDPSPKIIVQKAWSKINGSALMVKLIWLGLFLPFLDLASDLMAIYQHWTSNQRLLRKFSIGLIFSIIAHNLASTWYGWRNWANIDAENATKSKRRWPQNLCRVICHCLGLGDIHLTIEIIRKVLRKKSDER